MSAQNIYLSVGDGATTGYLDLLSAAHFVRPNGLRMPPPRAGERTRTVTLSLEISGTTADDMWTNVQRIERKLHEARSAAGAIGVGAGVTLRVQLDTTGFVYFDVLDGELSEPELLPVPTIVYATLTLTCLPYARGASYDTTVTGTLTNGDGATTLIENIPGDVPALVRARFTDVSTTSTFINRLRVGTFSLTAHTGADDFDPIRDATAVSPGTNGAEAGTIGGTRARVTLSDAWQYVAGATGATPTNRNAGLMDVWARVRSSAATPGVPTNVSRTGGTTGSLPAGEYEAKVVTVTAAGILSEASTSVFVTIPPGSSFDQINFTWTVGANAANHRVYWKRDTNAWLYKATGSASGSYSLTSETSATTADPPTTSELPSPSVRAAIGLSSATTLYPQPATETVLNNDLWEMVYLGTFPLPPLPAQDGGTTEGWVVRVQGKHSTLTPTLDVDAIYLFRHPDQDASQVTAEYTGLNLATLRRWMIETRRDGRTFGWLTNAASTVEAGSLDVQGGPLYVGPGDCLVWAHADKQNGVSDVVDVKWNLILTVTPRFKIIRGSP